MKRDSISIYCMRYGHMMQMERDKEGQIDVSIWERGFNNVQLSWRERLRMGWDVLVKGEPWADYLVMSPEDATKMREWLSMPYPPTDEKG